MSIFRRKPKPVPPNPLGPNTVIVNANRTWWECARCGYRNPDADAFCACGADARLAAI